MGPLLALLALLQSPTPLRIELRDTGGAGVPWVDVQLSNPPGLEEPQPRRVGWRPGRSATQWLVAGAVFDGTNLEGADLSSAVNYIIHPDRNRLKKARFSESGLAGLLAHAGIIIEPG